MESLFCVYLTETQLKDLQIICDDYVRQLDDYISELTEKHETIADICCDGDCPELHDITESLRSAFDLHRKYCSAWQSLDFAELMPFNVVVDLDGSDHD